MGLESREPEGEFGGKSVAVQRYRRAQGNGAAGRAGTEGRGGRLVLDGPRPAVPRLLGRPGRFMLGRSRESQRYPGS